MKILNTKKVVYDLILTDAEEYPSYRRDVNGFWENSMGESWEPVYYKQNELEKMYRDYLKKNE